MRVRSIEILWPYGPDSNRQVDQLDVVVDMEDGTRWMSAFRNTQRLNQGGESFKGLGKSKPFRVGPQIVLVDELTQETIETTVHALLEQGGFDGAFVRIGEPAPG